MNKADLRRYIIRRLADVSDVDFSAKSQVVLERLTRDIEWSAIRRLHIYRSQSQWREVDTSELSKVLQWRYPKILITTSPIDPAAPILREEFDAIVVPLLGFDETCHRLGRGAGWYDRFLATQPNALKIGLALEVQRIDGLSTEEHDVPLDVIITEESIYGRHD